MALTRRIAFWQFPILAAVLVLANFPVAADNVKDWETLVAQAKNESQKRALDKAEELWWSAVSKAETFGMNDPRYIETLYHLGEIALEKNDQTSAEIAFARAADSAEKNGSTNSLEFAQTLLNLGVVYGNTERFEKAIEVLSHAKAIVLQKAGENSYIPGLCNYLIGHTWLQAGNISKAKIALTEALSYLDARHVVTRPAFAGSRIIKQFYGEPPQFAVAATQVDLSDCYHREHDDAQAEASARKAIQLLEWEYGKDSGWLATPLSKLALILDSEQKFPEATQTAKRALSILNKHKGSPDEVRRARQLMDKIHDDSKSAK